MTLKPGDKVAYSVQFLKSIGEFSGEIPAARGVIKEIKQIAPDLQLAVIEWITPGLPEKVNVKNLAKVGLNTKFSEC